VVRAKVELVRLVRDEDGGVSVDRDGRMAGRGAYVCPTADCLEKALQAGRLGHAFKRASRPPRETVADVLVHWLASRTRR
jgi:predicted RNA-binding protein YlxR (DUF448 family)